MNCPHCHGTFDLVSDLPMLICLDGHTTCTKCANVLEFCPICTNITLFPPRINHSLVDHLSNLHHEEVCPVIPEESLEFDETCDEIGRGGCAVVYAAKWSGLDVAIKLATITVEGQDQLRKELGLLIKMNNPGILRVFGICFINSKVGIVMERANHSLIVPSGLTKKTLTYAKDICNAVRFLHSKSVVHGDLKPENVLMVQGVVRIADFGTSRIIKSTVDINPQSKQMITPKYAPPEAFDNQVVKEGDVYSLALILYEMLTDRSAFKGLRTYEALYGAKYREEGLLFDHAFPQQLQMVLNRSCVRNPFDRPTIEEILNCLDEVTHYVEQSELEVINCCSSNQNEQLRLEMQQLGRNYDELQQHNNGLRTDLDNSRNEVVQLKQTISNLTAQVTTLTEDKERLSNLVTEKEDSVSSSAQEVDRLKSVIINKNSRFQQTIRQKNEELEKYQNSSLKMEKTIQQLNEQNAKLNNLNKELESVNHEQAQKLDESRRLSAETENNREQNITELEKGNSDLRKNFWEKETPAELLALGRKLLEGGRETEESSSPRVNKAIVQETDAVVELFDDEEHELPKLQSNSSSEAQLESPLKGDEILVGLENDEDSEPVQNPLNLKISIENFDVRQHSDIPPRVPSPHDVPRGSRYEISERQLREGIGGRYPRSIAVNPIPTTFEERLAQIRNSRISNRNRDSNVDSHRNRNHDQLFSEQRPSQSTSEASSLPRLPRRMVSYNRTPSDFHRAAATRDHFASSPDRSSNSHNADFRSIPDSQSIASRTRSNVFSNQSRLGVHERLYRSHTQASRPLQQNRGPFIPNEAHFTKLMSMGFIENDIEIALRRTNNNLERALELLLAGFSLNV
ncbi:hypothetical protein P9112_014225 [Eukaryota sp. TZLM1-RC]